MNSNDNNMAILWSNYQVHSSKTYRKKRRNYKVQTRGFSKKKAMLYH